MKFFFTKKIFFIQWNFLCKKKIFFNSKKFNVIFCVTKENFLTYKMFLFNGTFCRTKKFDSKKLFCSIKCNFLCCKRNFFLLIRFFYLIELSMLIEFSLKARVKKLFSSTFNVTFIVIKKIPILLRKIIKLKVFLTSK